MKTGYAVALAMLAGIGMGTLGLMVFKLRPSRPCT